VHVYVSCARIERGQVACVYLHATAHTNTHTRTHTIKMNLSEVLIKAHNRNVHTQARTHTDTHTHSHIHTPQMYPSEVLIKARNGDVNQLHGYKNFVEMVEACNGFAQVRVSMSMSMSMSMPTNMCAVCGCTDTVHADRYLHCVGILKM